MRTNVDIKMNRLIVLIVLTLFTFKVFSQNFLNSINIDVRYPIATGNNFMNNNDLGDYKGIADVGIGLNLYQVKNISLGVQFNTSILRLRISDLTATGLSPKITASYDLRSGNVSIIPQAAFGFASWKLKAGQYVNTEQGMTVEGSLRIVLRRPGRLNFYILGSYQHTRLGKPKEGQLDSDYNRNISTFYPGIGLIVKLK
jgi:hypothetical protein